VAKQTTMVVPVLRFLALLFVSLLCAPLLHLPRCRTSSLLYANGLANNNNNNVRTTSPLHRHGGDVWVPPSQNTEQRRGNVFSIRHPEDLLDFIIEDDRLSVVKVYAGWCKTCKVFDVRYRKLASQFGDGRGNSKTRGGGSARISERVRVRFAEMELKDRNQEILSSILSSSKQPISLPYILMYKGSKGIARDFRCTPKEFRKLVDAVNELADPVFSEEIVADDRSGRGGSERLNMEPYINGDDSATSRETLDATAAASAKGLGAAQSYLSTLTLRNNNA